MTVFFEARLAREVGESLRTPAAVLLDKPEGHPTAPFRMVERLYPHDDAVTPVRHAIRLAVREGITPLVWLEEQLHVLLNRLLEVQRGFDPEVVRLPAVRRSTRVETYRRLSRARDFIEASLADPIGLAEMAQVACLSRHHFLRVFRQAFGVTPHRHLTNRRLDRAREILAQTDAPVREVCLAVGFESLGSFSHSFRRRFGISPRGLRRAVRDGTAAGSRAAQPWGRENGS